jgi:dye decolorizing peroxidase
MSSSTPAPRKITRRTALIGGGAVLGVGALATTVVVVTQNNSESDSTPFGAHQAGIARPATPQRHGLLSIFDFGDRDESGFPSALQRYLESLSNAIAQCASATAFDPKVTPNGPGDLTITIGLGPLVMARIDATLPGATELPLFVGDDQLPELDRGGDLLVAVYATDHSVLQAVTARVTRDLTTLRARWHQAGERAKGEGTVARNPLGHKDGIIVPRGEAELAENVWLADGPLAGGTMCVVRRLRLRIDDFRSETIARQDEIIGRHKIDGSPLSGGGPDSPIDVNAKTAEGDLLIPSRAHVRAAHPSFTGSALMLRRGYGFSNDESDRGLLFVCFQHDLDTFVKTQLRLDELDDLQQYARVTASASFVILPGFSPTVPLGAELFG